MVTTNVSRPVKRARLHEQVARTLSLQIIRREIEPLSLLPNEDLLCQQFDVSRTVIREAIRFMDAKGLVEVRPRIGTRINDPSHWALADSLLLRWQMESEPDIKLIHDLLELRSMIEPMASGLAAQRAAKSDIQSISNALEEMKTARNIDEHIAADLNFHLSVIESTGNELVVSSLRPVIENTLGTSFRRYIKSFDAAKSSLAVHEAVLEAIRNGNSDQAIIAMRGVISRSKKDIERFERISQNGRT